MTERKQIEARLIFDPDALPGADSGAEERERLARMEAMLKRIIELTADGAAIAVGERDAARLLGISPSMLAKLRKDGEVPFIMAGVRVLYSVERLREWARSNASDAAVEQAKG